VNERLQIQGYSHYAVSAENYDKSLEFYGKYLALPELCHLDYLDSGKRMLTCFKLNDSQVIEVFDRRNIQSPVRALHQLAFNVNNAFAWRDWFQSLGIAVPSEVHRGQMKNFGFIIEDADQNCLEFVQLTPESLLMKSRDILNEGPLSSAELIGVCLPRAGDPQGQCDFYRDILLLAREANGLAVGASHSIALQAPHQDKCRVVFSVKDLQKAQRNLSGSVHWPEEHSVYGMSIVLNDPDGLELQFVKA
jgi:catechol 2,3-dioxygenase-like lactoylglutathione lyase family enzyme